MNARKLERLMPGLYMVSAEDESETPLIVARVKSTFRGEASWRVTYSSETMMGFGDKGCFEDRYYATLALVKAQFKLE